MKFILLLIIGIVFVCYIHADEQSKTKPSIIFYLADDVGKTDLGYSSATKTIPTPYINQLVSGHGAVRLDKYYTQSLCTPTRASLLTGRYAFNAGMSFVIIPASPSGIPQDVETLPQILEKDGYRNYMTGKWHLGHAQNKLTPTQKGFHKFLGIFTWDIDSYTKRNYLFPPIFGGRYYYDWVAHTRDQDPYYFLEPEHSTIAITKESIKFIDEHVTEYPSSPLFLYVAYTAAHSPLVAAPEHEAKCQAIQHLWRRQFCGLAVGMDESMEKITKHAISKFGNNTIIVFSSDNGGSSWFGGLNYPLRGSKNTPFEGGVNVPGFIVDFRQSLPDRTYNGLFHVSDFLPTLLALSNVAKDKYSNINIDGLDHSKALYNPSSNIEVRTEVLLELRLSNYTIFEDDLFAYRWGKYKLIVGAQNEDGNHYLEPTGDSVSMKNKKILSYVHEQVIRFGEFLIGTTEFDSLRIVLTHHFKTIIEHHIYRNKIPSILLFNLDEDPYETVNIAEQYPEIVNIIKSKVYDVVRRNKTPIQNPRLQYNLLKWPNTFIKGDCSRDPKIPDNQCIFSAPWIDDSVEDPFSLTEDFTLFLNTKIFNTTLTVAFIVCSFLLTIITILLSTKWTLDHFTKKTK